MTDAPFKRFLVVCDTQASTEPTVIEFGPGEGTKAMDAYEELERLYRGKSWIHVVLLGADSIETIKVTHGNYWPSETKNTFADLRAVLGESGARLLDALKLDAS
jgi:hypothetical protein